MLQTSTVKRLSVGTLVTIAMLLTAPAYANHGPKAPGGPYRGFATGSAVHLDAGSTASARVLDLETGVASAQVNSQGLARVLSEYNRDLVPGATDKAHAGGYSTIVEAGAGLQPPDAENQMKPWTGLALAPSDTAAADKTVLNQAVGPALFVELLRNTAHARWNADTCVVGDPISDAAEHLARVDVGETGDDPSTPASGGFDKPVLSLSSEQVGPPRATTHVASKEWLFKSSGPGLGLYSVTTSTLAPVTLFKGTANEFTVESDGPAYLVARADGVAGGAKVLSHVPLVTVIQGGKETTVAPSAPIIVKVPSTGQPLAEIRVGVTDPLPAPKGLDDTLVSPDGLRAAAQANVVEVKLLHNAGTVVSGTTFALGHMEAAALVPPGGITCPLPVTKAADPTSMSVGDTFVTTIGITNPYSCPINDVRLTDDISVESGALFEILGTSPPAVSTTHGSHLSRGHILWELGTIPPKGHKSVTVSLRAQGAAGKIPDIAQATGNLSNCPISPAEGGADVSGLARATASVTGSASTTVSVSQVLGRRVTRARSLPRTGVADTSATGFALLGAATVVAARIRRTKLRAR